MVSMYYSECLKNKFYIEFSTAYFTSVYTDKFSLFSYQRKRLYFISVFYTLIFYTSNFFISLLLRLSTISIYGFIAE